MKNLSKKRFGFISVNLFIFITTIIAIAITLNPASQVIGLDSSIDPIYQLGTFTLLSNIFLALVAFITSVIAFKTRKNPLPKSLVIWYLIAASAVALTFLVVALFLAPTRALGGQSYFDMFVGPMFFLHFLNPLLAALTFIFLTDDEKLSLKLSPLALIPLLIYSVPYTTCSILLKVWPDFYGLAFNDRFYLTLLSYLVLGTTICVASLLLTALRNKRLQKP